MPETDRNESADRGALARLRADFDLAILISFGLLAVLVVAAFAVYRYLSDDWLGTAVDVAIVLALTLVLAFAWRSEDSRRAGSVFVLLAAAGCLASALVFGRTGVYWTFLVLWINFLLAGRALASGVNGVVVFGFVIQPTLFETGSERAAYAVTATLITLYGWIFAERMTAQRRQLERLASHDPLTGAGNRRLLQQDLEAAAADDARAGHTVLAVLDLDHFKHVNDSRGHEAGDRVLVRLTETVRARIRRRDGFYRFGGEEFVLLLADADVDSARELLDDLRQRINETLAEHGDPVTVSVGAAALEAGERWSVWLGRADAALYGAKQAGRDRVVFHGDAEAAPVGRRSGDGAAST